MVKVNGQELKLAGKSVAEYLAEAQYEPRRVAVELNGQIVPRAQYATSILRDGDVLELVSFVGGG